MDITHGRTGAGCVMDIEGRRGRAKHNGHRGGSPAMAVVRLDDGGLSIGVGAAEDGVSFDELLLSAPSVAHGGLGEAVEVA